MAWQSLYLLNFYQLKQNIHIEQIPSKLLKTKYGKDDLMLKIDWSKFTNDDIEQIRKELTSVVKAREEAAKEEEYLKAKQRDADAKQTFTSIQEGVKMINHLAGQYKSLTDTEIWFFMSGKKLVADTEYIFSLKQ